MLNCDSDKLNFINFVRVSFIVLEYKLEEKKGKDKKDEGKETN